MSELNEQRIAAQAVLRYWMEVDPDGVQAQHWRNQLEELKDKDEGGTESWT